MVLRTSAKTISLAAILFVGAATALAQQGAGISPPPSTQDIPTPGQPGKNGNIPGADSPGNQPSTTSLADQAFLQDTFKDDQTQLQMSQLAQQKSSSDDVKQFSQRMVEIHTNLDKQLKAIAQHLQVTEPDQPSKQQKQEIAKLQQLSGPDFDTAYLQAMAKEQQRNLKEFKEEAGATQEPLIQSATKADAPALNQNLLVLEKLAQAHNVALDEKK
jgi:putative membrane protein